MSKSLTRKNNRLKNYNYSDNGFYFVTICTKDKKNIFGQYINPVGAQRAVPETVQEKTPKININQYGQIVCEEWKNTQYLRNNVKLDEFVIMPNHIHGIIIINDTGTARCAPTGLVRGPVSCSLSAIIRSFKSAVTNRINKLRQTTKLPIWQRSFYDHVIRVDESLYKIREYIRNNPATWDKDEYNEK